MNSDRVAKCAALTSIVGWPGLECNASVCLYTSQIMGFILNSTHPLYIMGLLLHWRIIKLKDHDEIDDDLWLLENESETNETQLIGILRRMRSLIAMAMQSRLWSWEPLFCDLPYTIEERIDIIQQNMDETPMCLFMEMDALLFEFDSTALDTCPCDE